MDQQRAGALLKKLRLEKGMTQRQLAEILSVSDKAVSKWERGAGMPDIATLPHIARALGADLQGILEGKDCVLQENGGNMNRIRFYVCPTCGNVMVMTGSAEVSCCGRRLEAMKQAACNEAHRLEVERMDGEWYIHFDHPMDKAHYVQFVAAVKYDRVMLVRLYPEQGGELRMPYMPRCTYYFGCSKDGLFTQKG